jgi:hypothetical protein
MRIRDRVADGYRTGQRYLQPFFRVGGALAGKTPDEYRRSTWAKEAAVSHMS